MYTMQQVDAHVEHHFDAVSAAVEANKVDNTTLSLVFKAAIPILGVVTPLLFFRPKWQAVIVALQAGMAAFITSVASLDTAAGGSPAAVPADTIAKAASPVATEGATMSE